MQKNNVLDTTIGEIDVEPMVLDILKVYQQSHLIYVRTLQSMAGGAEIRTKNTTDIRLRGGDNTDYLLTT